LSKKQYLRLAGALALILVMGVGCTAGRQTTKGREFPLMYDARPMTILVAPPINTSTAVEAKDYYSTTITEPLAQKGFYVIPYELSSALLQQEGAYDAELFVDGPLESFREHFGADAVLFTTIERWDLSYLVVASKMTVAIDCQLRSTHTGVELWKYKGTIVVDLTESGQKSLLANVILTAINTMAADYVPAAKRVNLQILASIPVGPYHPQHGKDMENRLLDQSPEVK
jgi:hypothetical protein